MTARPSARRFGGGEERDVALVGQLEVETAISAKAANLAAWSGSRYGKSMEIGLRSRFRVRSIEDDDVFVDLVELEVEPVDVADQLIAFGHRDPRRLDGRELLPAGVVGGVQRVQRAVAPEQPRGVARRLLRLESTRCGL